METTDPRMTPETKAFAEFLNGTGDIIAKDLNAFRQLVDTMDEAVNSNTKFEDIEFEERLIKNEKDNNDVPVTVYLPKQRTPNSSIVVYFHGGAFKFLSRKSYHRSISHVSKATNTIWVSVEYRLSPENKYPKAKDDCLIVTEWVLNNKHLLGSDASANVGVGGDSAGGNLAALVALELRQQLNFQILIFPWLDLTCSSKSYNEFSTALYGMRYEFLEPTIKDYLNEGDNTSSPSISPYFTTDYTGLPKAFLLLSELDPLVDEGKAYYAKLQQAHIESELKIVNGAVHGFFNAYDNYPSAFKQGSDFLINYLNSI